MHYVKYALACKQRNFTLAEDSIHEYFDSLDQEEYGDDANLLTCRTMNQYALLNLSILHTNFGHMKEAHTVYIILYLIMTQVNQRSHRVCSRESRRRMLTLLSQVDHLLSIITKAISLL